mgnify:CR=1 FL=1
MLVIFLYFKEPGRLGLWSVSDVDWIFENGELDFLPKAVVNEFLKDRFNRSLNSIGIDTIFDTDEKLLAETEWFDDEIIGTKHGTRMRCWGNLN